MLNTCVLCIAQRSTTTEASSTASYLSDRDLIDEIDNAGKSGSVSTYAYEYNAIGQRTHVVNTGTAFSADAHNAYGYNDRREVTGSERFLGTDLENPGSEVTAQRREYVFDTIGNRESHADGGGAAVGYTPDNLNQYSAIGSENPVYDDDGNLTDDGEHEYVWDAENRLVEVKPAASPSSGDKRLTFAYDYMGRRVEKEAFEWTGSSWSFLAVERYLWDEWNLLLVLDGNNNAFRKYTWGLDIAERASGLPRGGRPGAAAGGVGGLLAVEEVSGTHSGDYVYFYDANGNVGQVLDWSTETIAAHYQYDPFGREITATGSYAAINPFRFSTKHTDPTTGLVYYGFRFYSPGQGRFLNRDPIKETGFLNTTDDSVRWMGEEDLNDYGFVQNDPVNRYDMLGLSSSENGDSSKCKVCGPDITGVLSRTIDDVESTFARLPRSQQRDVCNSIVSAGGWDIMGLRTGSYTQQCGESGDCAQSVWVDGGCHYRGSVNYVLYGTMFRLCGKSERWMRMTIWIYKRGAGNYGPSQDWAKAGFDGWPGASTPSPDRPQCAECEHSSQLQHFHGFAGSGSPGIMHFGQPPQIERP